MSSGYYDRVSGSALYFPAGSQSEPNIRQEMTNTINGANPEIAKGHYIIWRQLTRDLNGRAIPCDCVSLGESEKDFFCPICFSVGHLWTESWIKVYSTLEAGSDISNAFLDKVLPPGIMNIPAVAFYTEYDSSFKRGDRLIEVSLGDDGSVLEPVVRQNCYRINFAQDLRADNGKLEYWKLYTHREDLKHLNVPEYDNGEGS